MLSLLSVDGSLLKRSFLQSIESLMQATVEANGACGLKGPSYLPLWHWLENELLQG